jgi:succinate-semialdehyde dehydrogenase/glutarate-semialdehyde dehydrogenase
MSTTSTAGDPLVPPGRLFVGGRWVDPGSRRPVVDPATGLAFTEVAWGGRQQVAEGLAAAAAAFPAWRSRPAKARGAILQALADRLERHADVVARLITAENGKPLPQSQAEVAMSADHLRWFAEEGKRAYGRFVPPQVEGKRNLVVRTPVGPVGAIAPWNFPLALAVRKVAPALAAGCTVVLKPATQTPLSCLAFAALGEDAGLPQGTLSVVTGAGSEVGAELLENPLCRKITFTGSTEVGRRLIAGAAPFIKPLSLELGGHAPAIVFADADLDRAVEGILLAKFRNTGQSCIAANRVYVERTIFDRFAEALTARVRALVVGPGLAPGVDVGPLIDEAALGKALLHITDARSRGARLLHGGTRVGTAGYFLAPTLLADVPAEALCMREETFAPIAPLVPFDDEDAVIAAANASPYGLASYAFTRDLARALRLGERLEAGSIGINDGVPTVSTSPFGGLKQSGWGRELGSEGLDTFLDTKHVSIAERF